MKYKVMLEVNSLSLPIVNHTEKNNVYKLTRHPASKYCILNKFHTYRHL